MTPLDSTKAWTAVPPIVVTLGSAGEAKYVPPPTENRNNNCPEGFQCYKAKLK